jgi:predicted O-methyltransferase YrrM
LNPFPDLRRVGRRLLGQRLFEWVTKRAATRSIGKALAMIGSADEDLSPDALVALMFSNAFVQLRPWQHQGELLALARELGRRRPKTILEIGTAAGGTLLLSTRLADANAAIFSIDLPSGPYGGGYPEWKMPLYRSFAKAGQRIELIRGDSHSDEVFGVLQRLLEDRRIDYLFIDADHSYEGVRRDFEMYSALLAEGAMVAFHDIAMNESGPDRLVPAYWKEIKNRYESREIIADPDQGDCGLGVLIYRSDEQDRGLR